MCVYAGMRTIESAPQRTSLARVLLGPFPGRRRKPGFNRRRHVIQNRNQMPRPDAIKAPSMPGAGDGDRTHIISLEG